MAELETSCCGPDGCEPCGDRSSQSGLYGSPRPETSRAGRY